MKKEQLEGKFIVCRTKDEVGFVVYWAHKLFDYNMNYIAETFRKKPRPICIRLKPISGYGNYGYNDAGDYATAGYGYQKEEECSVLFGNQVRRWAHENRTANGNSLP